MSEFIRLRDITTQGIDPESPAVQAMLRPLLELVSAIFAEQGYQDVTIELTLKMTPAPRLARPEKAAWR
jgi:hypothetical protein